MQVETMTSSWRSEDSSSLNGTFQPRTLYWVLSASALVYAAIAGLRTVSDYDVFWQMATGKWVVEQHSILSSDVFSFTAQGQPWIYPVGSGILFYLVFLLGGYALVSWMGVAAGGGTVAALLRRGSFISSALAVVAVPAIAARTSPRAEMFSVLLFAVFLSILWQQHQTGHAKLWMLPLLMLAWVNLHLGFISGIVLSIVFLVAGFIRAIFDIDRAPAVRWFATECAWLSGVFLATLFNPWGWRIYLAVFRQNAAMSVHSVRITEWAGVSLNRANLVQAFSPRLPGSSAEWLLAGALLCALLALFRKKWLAAMLLGGAFCMSMQHVRFLALLACVVVVVGGDVFTSAAGTISRRIPDVRIQRIVRLGVTAALILLAGIRSFDLVSDRYYVTSNEISSFGQGLSWWFPERAAAFIKQQKLPAQIFNGYEQGGFLIWTLFPNYKDYIDGRAIPFGPNLFNHLQEVLQSPPDSPIWQHEADSYGINTVLFSVARYNGLKYVGPILPEFCNSKLWQPVYLDEVSAVFVRRSPQTQALIDRFGVDCSVAALPNSPGSSNKGSEFNRWANSAAVLLTLSRYQEAASASEKALSAFNGSAALWYIRGKALLLSGDPRDAEQALLRSAALETNAVTWSELADLYRRQNRFPEAIGALELLIPVSPSPAPVQTALGYTYLQASRPRDALQAFDKAESLLSADGNNPAALADVANGRALAWNSLGNLKMAALFEERAVSLAPGVPDYWYQLARFYQLEGRAIDAQRAIERGASLSNLHGQ